LRGVGGEEPIDEVMEQVDRIASRGRPYSIGLIRGRGTHGRRYVAWAVLVCPCRAGPLTEVINIRAN